MTGEQLERDFQRRVIDCARVHGWRAYSVPDSRRASEKGFPDLTLWHPNLKIFLMAELKRDKGVLRPEQVIVHEELRGCGINVFVWRPENWDDITKILELPRSAKRKREKK